MLRCTKWLPELKLEKTSNDISAVTTGQISTKLDKIVSWEVLYQNCSKLSASLHLMAPCAKNRKKTSNNISVTTGQISTKLDRIVLLEVLCHNCSNCFSLLHKRATRVKDRKNFKQHLLNNYLADFNKAWILPWEVFYQNCSAPLHKMEARAINRKISKYISSVTSWWISTKLDRVVPREVPYKNYTNCSTSVHKMVARATNIKEISNSTSSITPLPISTKLDRIVPWDVFYQNCSNNLAPLLKMATRAKNRKKNFKQHLLHYHMEDFNQT